MKSLFKRHRVRATFYHFSAIIVLLVTVLSVLGMMSANVALYTTLILFFADYAAEMYDPNPDSPGPWFKAHFHRFLDDSDDSA